MGNGMVKQVTEALEYGWRNNKVCLSDKLKALIRE
jgi:hypothetical protein